MRTLNALDPGNFIFYVEAQINGHKMSEVAAQGSHEAIKELLANIGALFGLHVSGIALVRKMSCE